MTVKVYKDDTLIEGINIALRNRLYISGWTLSNDLVYHRKSPNGKEQLAIYYKDDVPVAIAFYACSSVQAFTRKSERRRGYGSQCVKALKLNNFASVGDGIDGSWNFWRAVDLA